MAQRISRAKRTLRERRLNQPGDLAVVLRVLYLVYTAGHMGSPTRVDLANEAIRLARQLNLATEEPEARELHALMLLNHARLPARHDPEGRIVTLDRQNRGRWDTRKIAEACASSVGTGHADGATARGRYQVEAAIAALHDDAASAEETDWLQILAWYDDLVKDPVRQDPPRVLGRAVAVGHVLGGAAGLRETDRLREVIGERHRWHAVRGHLHELDGDLPAAATAYAGAARRATTSTSATTWSARPPEREPLGACGGGARARHPDAAPSEAASRRRAARSARSPGTSAVQADPTQVYSYCRLRRGRWSSRSEVSTADVPAPADACAGRSRRAGCGIRTPRRVPAAVAGLAACRSV